MTIEQIYDYNLLIFGIGGGPCSGKTSIMPYLVEHLGNMGYKVYIVPEAATILINGGMDKIKPDFQYAVFETMMTLEN